MASASPVTSKFYLIKWLYVETLPIGKKIGTFKVTKLHADNNLNVWCNDFEDSFLTHKDSKAFGELIDKRINAWIKIICDPKEVENSRVGFKYQACYLCLECKNENQIQLVEEVLSSHDEYDCRVLMDFPWYRDTFESPIVTY